MILNLFVLLISAGVWIAALWLVLLPGMAGWPDAAVAAVHVAPPVGASFAWALLRRRIQHKRAVEAQAREEQAEAERSTAREAAMTAYKDEIHRRRFACDARMVAFSRLGLPVDSSLPDSGLPNVDLRPVHLSAEKQSGSLLEELGPALDEALFSIFFTCRAAFAFPIYISPPAELSGEEVMDYLHAARSAIAEELAPEMKRQDILAPMLFLPSSETVAGSIISLFESSPEMPGALILAFDSPHWRSPSVQDAFDEQSDDERMARERYLGSPGEAVVALLMTNTELPYMLNAISSYSGVDRPDSMTPFWETAVKAGGALEALLFMAPALRDELSELPVLARVHRASMRCPAKQSGVLELTRLYQDVLEQAQMNAGLLDPPFPVTEDSPAVTGAKARETEETCGAIVHNAGGVDVAGKRLAALGAALYHFDIDLSPVDRNAAFNMVTGTGDLGRASGVAQLALSLTYAAQNAAPALCAEFMKDDSIAISIVMPA